MKPGKEPGKICQGVVKHCMSNGLLGRIESSVSTAPIHPSRIRANESKQSVGVEYNELLGLLTQYSDVLSMQNYIAALAFASGLNAFSFGTL